MTADPYAMCPGGTGKKVKFCCPDLVSELGKLDQLTTAGQQAGALAQVERLLEKHPDRPCLMSIQARLLRQSGEVERAQEAVAKLVESDPRNPVALAEGVLQQVSRAANPKEVVDHLQEAIAATAELPEPPDYLIDALERTATYLLIRGEFWSARAHLELLARFRRNERSVELLASVLQSPRISLLVKSLPGYPREIPAQAPWADDFHQALEILAAGRTAEGMTRLERLCEQYPDEPTLWRHLGAAAADLVDKPRAVLAFRRMASLPIPLDDAVEAEALAQSFAEDTIEGNLDIASVEYEVADVDALMRKLDDHPRVAIVRFDPREHADAGGVSPRGMYKLVDRPRPASGEGLALDAVPRVLADLAVFGKQTDRPARLQLITYRDQRFGEIQKALAEIAGDSLAGVVSDRAIGHTGLGTRSLSVELDYPADTSAGHRLDLMQRLQREIVWEVWPHTPKEVLGRRTPAEAAADPNRKIEALASLLRLEAAQLATTIGFDFNTLRQKLNLPTADPIGLEGVQLDYLPVVRLSRVAVAELDDNTLIHLHQNATVVAALTAIRRSAEEMLRRPDLLKEYPADLLHGELSRLEPDPRASLPHLAAAAKAAEDAGRSPALWYLEEIPLRLAIGEAEDAMELVKRLLERHAREPGVREAVLQLLQSLGLDLEALAQQGAAAPPVEENRIWTPGAESPGAGKKSPLWMPGDA